MFHDFSPDCIQFCYVAAQLAASQKGVSTMSEYTDCAILRVFAARQGGEFKKCTYYFGALHYHNV
jgi:hypothetical protein